MQKISAKIARNKTILVRVDYNVPLVVQKKITVADDSRIQASLATIKLLLKAQAKVVLMTHVGRPQGKVNPQLSTLPIAQHLALLLDQPVQFIKEKVGLAAKAQVKQVKPGQVALLENLRFYPEEKENDSAFSQALASLAQLYVNEAFSTSHRAHASIVGVAKYLPSFAGLALANEVEALSCLMNKPKRPFVMVVGGAKISDKVEAVLHLSQIADVVLVGGGVANNFLKADGYDVASSYLQETAADAKPADLSCVKLAKEIITRTRTDRLLKDGYIPLPKIIYPIDVVAAQSPKSKKTTILNLTNGYENLIKRDLMYLDVGPKTIRLYQELILQAKTVFWNGPMGVFEQEQFAHGTREIARAVAKASGLTILGGGDTIAAINKFGFADRYDYVSAAGGASLEFLAGKELPGLKALAA